MNQKKEAQQAEQLQWEKPEIVDLDLSLESVEAVCGVFDDGVTPGLQPSS